MRLNFEVLEAPTQAKRAALRYPNTALFGERVKWLPPYRLVPSFASADGKSAVYRRRSQVILSADSEGDAAGAATSFAVGDGEFRVRIDEYGYARLVRPSRTSQHVDPVSSTVDGAADMEREAALAVCAHLNEHVDAVAFPHRWTPSPNQVLLPAVRPFSELKPEEPKPVMLEGRPKPVIDKQEFNDYLNARAKWLARRLAWDASQRDLLGRREQAMQGDKAAMHEHLLSCLHDILWPLPTQLGFELTSATEVKLDFLIPGLDVTPDREAAIGSGNRVAIRRMTDLVHARVHNMNGLGLVVRLLGELFAALPTLQTATVSALQQPAGKGARFVASARANRAVWCTLHDAGFATGDLPTICLQHLKARVNLTGLGAFIPIEPFD